MLYIIRKVIEQAIRISNSAEIAALVQLLLLFETRICFVEGIHNTNSALFCLDANNSWTRASISTKFEIMIACSITFLMMYGMIYFCWALFVCANDFQLSSIARTAMHNGADNPARCFRVYTMTTAKRVRWFQPDFRF